MDIELKGRTVAIEGESNPVVAAAIAALERCGASMAGREDTSGADILIVSLPLLPETPAPELEPLLDNARAEAALMRERGGGRIVFLLSALAALPMRRHPDHSARMAAAAAAMRALAMAFAPEVLVNGVGLGITEAEAEETVAGDGALLSHVPVGRPGRIDEAIAAVLFFCDPMNSYTTGQLLLVDGGWYAGYGRSF